MHSRPEAPPDAVREDEAPLDPALPIVDAHHHLWDFQAAAGIPQSRYLLPEFLGEVGRSGQRVTHTVFVETGAMYRADGPRELRAVGETEFANGVAAMSASGRYGACRVAAGIVAAADLRLGDRVRPVLEAQIAAGNGRVRGVRFHTAWSDVPVFSGAQPLAGRGLLADATVRAGAAALASYGLSWDIWGFHYQLAEIAAAADAVPNVSIILDHLASPFTLGVHAGRRNAVFADWSRGIGELARRPNVSVKLGGLGMDFAAPLATRAHRASSVELAADWRPFVERCIAAFGAQRCMFESNFPPDAATCGYGTLWNAFKRITAACSDAEKTALFSGTAKRVYRLA